MIGEIKMLKSVVQQRGNVKFANQIGERIYMREFYKHKGLPTDIKHWQNTVDAMLDGVDTDGPIYLMVDQSVVKAGNPHRRPGVHIDGYWNPGISAHGGHRGISAHGGMPSHKSQPTHGGWPGRSHISMAQSWEEASYEQQEGIILASSVTAAKAYNGEFVGKPKDGGDCAHINLSSLECLDMQAGVVYAGNVTMLHESVAVPHDCIRTVVRLNVPGWHP
jgi:hypothetical protein